MGVEGCTEASRGEPRQRRCGGREREKLTENCLTYRLSLI